MSFQTCTVFLASLVMLSGIEAKSTKKISLEWEEVLSCPGFENKDTDISRAAIYMANETAIGLKGVIEIKRNLEMRPIMVKTTVDKEMLGGNFMTMLTYEIPDLCEKLDNPDDTWSPYLLALKPSLTNCDESKNIYDVSEVRPSTDVELRKDMTGSYRSRIEMFRPAAEGSGRPEMWCCYELEMRIVSGK